MCHFIICKWRVTLIIPKIPWYSLLLFSLVKHTNNKKPQIMTLSLKNVYFDQKMSANSKFKLDINLKTKTSKTQ